MITSQTVVLLQNMIACNLEKNGFQNARVFNPNRWIDSDGELIPIKPQSIVQPFGSGKRGCPGKKFTEMQLTMLVIKVSLNPLHLIAANDSISFLVNPYICDQI